MSIHMVPTGPVCKARRKASAENMSLRCFELHTCCLLTRSNIREKQTLGMINCVTAVVFFLYFKYSFYLSKEPTKTKQEDGPMEQHNKKKE